MNYGIYDMNVFISRKHSSLIVGWLVLVFTYLEHHSERRKQYDSFCRAQKRVRKIKHSP